MKQCFESSQRYTSLPFTNVLLWPHGIVQNMHNSESCSVIDYLGAFLHDYCKFRHMFVIYCFLFFCYVKYVILDATLMCLF